MQRPPTTPRLAVLYATARKRPLRGALAAGLIFAAGLNMRAAEHLLGLPDGFVVKTASEVATHRRRTQQKEATP
jgi:hypothetical protein